MLEEEESVLSSKCFKVDWMRLWLLKPLVSSIRLAANSTNSSSEWYCLVGNEMGTNLGDGVDTLKASCI